MIRVVHFLQTEKMLGSRWYNVHCKLQLSPYGLNLPADVFTSMSVLLSVQSLSQDLQDRLISGALRLSYGPALQRGLEYLQQLGDRNEMVSQYVSSLRHYAANGALKQMSDPSQVNSGKGIGQLTQSHDAPIQANASVPNIGEDSFDAFDFVSMHDEPWLQQFNFEEMFLP